MKSGLAEISSPEEEDINNSDDEVSPNEDVDDISFIMFFRGCLCLRMEAEDGIMRGER